MIVLGMSMLLTVTCKRRTTEEICRTEVRCECNETIYMYPAIENMSTNNTIFSDCKFSTYFKVIFIFQTDLIYIFKPRGY